MILAPGYCKLTAAMSALTRQSPAKINLTLRVGARQPDGYHEIESLVARISLCDTVSVAPRSDRRATLECSEPGVPCDERNLALQAALRLADAVGVRRGVHISIHKRIPAGAGLGGGSSNAASVLLLLNQLWGLGLSNEELARIGARIGADVPLFLHRPVCVVRGRGERVEVVEQPLAARVLLFLPELHCATQAVYATWDRLGSQPQRPPLGDVLAKLHSPADLATRLFNDLEEPAFTVRPELRTLAEHLRKCCPEPVHLTGSGSALFCLSDALHPPPAAERIVRDAPLAVRAVLATIES